MAVRRGRDRAQLRGRLGGSVPADIRGVRRCLAAACLALHLVTAGVARAEAIAQLPAEQAKPAGRSGGDPGGDPGAPAGAAESTEPGESGTHRLEVTGIQCEALSLGKSIKELPEDAHVETITFTEPPPVTFRLPEQRRESLTECSLRASGLTVRIDKSRNVITLLPTGTASPENPNAKVKVLVKLVEEAPAKP